MVKLSLTEEEYGCCAIKPAGKRTGFRNARGSAFATAKCHTRTVQSINAWMLGTSTCALSILRFFTLGMSWIRRQRCVEGSRKSSGHLAFQKVTASEIMWLRSAPEDVLSRKELQVGSSGNGLLVYSRASLVKDRTGTSLQKAWKVPSSSEIMLQFETSGLEESA